VLAQEVENEKAIFRKGCAYRLAQKYERAIAEFKKCTDSKLSRS
jgi:hypothetical protein